MAQALPVHIISEIERRWQRRLDAQPQAKPVKNDERSIGLGPLCDAAASVEPASADNAVARRD